MAIDVVRDTEGIRMALAEIFEQDLDRARVMRSMENARPDTRDRLLASVVPLTLSPGYHRVAGHLLELEAEREAGLPLSGLAAWEGAGLMVLRQARTAHEIKHPACGACGIRQANRYQPQCESCGVKFRGKK